MKELLKFEVHFVHLTNCRSCEIIKLATNVTLFITVFYILCLLLFNSAATVFKSKFNTIHVVPQYTFYSKLQVASMPC